MTEVKKRTRFGHRVLGGILTSIFVASGIWVGVVTTKVVSPSQGTVSDSDAVVSLAPYPHRLPVAYQLFRSKPVDALAISWFPGAYSAGTDWESNDLLEYQLCAEADNPQIICFTPEPATTIGEALAVRELAAEYGWTSITVVTSRYHAFRTNYIFDHCVSHNLNVELIYSDHPLGVMAWFKHIAYENAALVKAIFETRANCA